MERKVTKEEKEYLERRLKELEVQAAKSTETLRDQDFRPAFCSGNNGFDDLPNYEIFENNARIRNEISEVRDTLNRAVVDEVSTEEIGLGSKFVATLNDLDGSVVTKKYTLFSGIFLAFDEKTEFTLVSVNSPFGKAVLSKKVNDEFTFLTPDKIRISGVIDEIVSEKTIEDAPKQLVKTEKNTRK